MPGPLQAVGARLFHWTIVRVRLKEFAQAFVGAWKHFVSKERQAVCNPACLFYSIQTWPSSARGW